LLRNALFQVHWFVGITVGIVIALVGVTGAILSFEPEILHALNRDVRSVAMASAELLPPSELLARLQTDDPARRVASLAVWSDTSRAARVTYMPEEVPRDSKDASPPRGDVRYVDPRAGRVAAAKGDRGETFFRTTRSLHRWLIADRLGDRDVGRQIIGAATIVLVFLTLSGLYLRWPRGRARNWRPWLTFDPRLKGRTFLWHLHAISGTWVLIAYLVMSLTGLQWSYEWYRNGLIHLSGAQPARPRGEPPIASADRQPVWWDRAKMETVWSGFVDEVGADRYQMVTIELPAAPAETLSIRYLDPDPRHDRAYSSVEIRIADGAIERHARYADKSFGDRLMASIFPLHSGRYFGIGGVIVFMMASLAMPLFAITGWLLYLARRRRKRHGRVHVPEDAGLATGAASAASTSSIQ